MRRINLVRHYTDFNEYVEFVPVERIEFEERLRKGIAKNENNLDSKI